MPVFYVLRLRSSYDISKWRKGETSPGLGELKRRLTGINGEARNFGSGICWDHEKQQPFNLKDRPSANRGRLGLSDIAFLQPKDNRQRRMFLNYVRDESLFLHCIDGTHDTLMIDIYTRLMHDVPKKPVRARAAKRPGEKPNP